MQVSDLLPWAVLPEPQRTGVQECSTSILMSPRPKPVGAEESQPSSPVVSVPVQWEATDLIDQSGAAPRTWQVRSDGQRQALLDFSCPRLQAVELLLDSPRGLSWIDNAAGGLKLPSALRPPLRGRIRLLLMRGARGAFDMTVNCFDNRVLVALVSLTPEVRVCVFKDSTSPLPILGGLSHDVLDRGNGQVGSIPIPDFICDALAPSDFSLVSNRDVGPMRQMSEEGLTMARALVRDGVLSLW